MLCYLKLQGVIVLTDEQKLIDYLNTFIEKMENNDVDTRKIYHDPKNERFFYIADHNFDDFCKQVQDEYLGIYVDSDFWIVAQLPSCYKNISCSDIVDILWGTSEDDEFLPDHGTPEYEQYFENIRFEHWKILRQEYKNGKDVLSELSIYLLSTKPEFYDIYKNDLNDEEAWILILKNKEQYEK